MPSSVASFLFFPKIFTCALSASKKVTAFLQQALSGATLVLAGCAVETLTSETSAVEDCKLASFSINESSWTGTILSASL
ncbi:hypothetical protein BJ741DRAFT_605340 [Chytriomyces cf. hyalinus JEL632]|nr:hypothetical protein BJ741DRAFT_605340 [Chytriomyces cf. hyalinus JEL632]